MAQVIFSGGTRRHYGRGISPRPVACLTIVLGLMCMPHVPFGFAQTAPANAQAGLKKEKGVPANAKSVPDLPVPPPRAVLAIDQTPPRPPVIAWDGKQLTIDAENATLSDILLGIRSRTGASIEMPQSTAAERVAVHLGPAPIREVLSALLYGTDFNYVIQASEKDESGLGKVILIPRDGDKSDSAVASDAPGNPNIRLMPGYSAPGKRDYEVAHENAVDDAASPLEQPSVSEGAAPQEQNQAASTESASTAAPPSGTADAQPAPSNPDSADAAPPAADATMSAGEIQPSHNPAGLLSPSLPTPGEAPSISQMEQNLQNLYQQRRQLQAQQNHTAPAQGN